MALIQLGALATGVSGTVGGITWQQGSTGPIVRTKPKPPNPKSINQQGIRANLAGSSKTYSSTLTDTERQTWVTFASTHTIKDVFGNNIHLNGLQWFVRINAIISKVGGTKLTSAPADQTVGDPGSMSASASSGFSSVFVGSGVAPTGDDCPVILASKIVNPGKTSAKAILNVLQTFPAATASPWDVSTAFTTKYGGFFQDDCFFMGLVFARKTNGAQSILYTFRVVAGP